MITQFPINDYIFPLTNIRNLEYGNNDHSRTYDSGNDGEKTG